VCIPRRQPHDHIQVVIQPSQIGSPRALGQALAPPRQHHGPQQQHLHARGKHYVSRVNGVLAVAQLMRQADLPEIVSGGLAPFFNGSSRGACFA
jgi:hypothetical protein